MYETALSSYLENFIALMKRSENVVQQTLLSNPEVVF